jgi:hypothetical protein
MARFITVVLAAMIGLGALQISAPTAAGGITLMVTPDGESADIIQQGLRIYSIVQEQKEKKKRKNHARVDQKGRDNAGAVSRRASTIMV